MTTYQPKDLSGSLFKNDKREKDTHPNLTGSVMIGGVEYWVSAWKRKEGASPKAPALSFSVKPKDEAPPQRTGGGNVPGANPFPDEDIPF